MRGSGISAVVLALAVNAGFAQSTPQFIKLQGSLSQSGVGPVTGTVTMTFALHDTPSGGAPIVTMGPMQVNVTDGLYDVELALPSSAFGNPERYMEITVNAETLSPRVRLGSTAFAYLADSVDGHEGSDLEESAEIDSKVAAHTVQADPHPGYVKKAGDVMSGPLQVVGTVQSFSGGFVFPDGSTQSTAAIGGPGAGNTLDEAYDQGGSGAGRTIIADSGPVVIAGGDGLTVNEEFELRSQGGNVALDARVLSGDARLVVGSTGLSGVLQVRDINSLPVFEVNAPSGLLSMWENDGPVPGGRTITLDSRGAQVTIGAQGSDGTLRINNSGNQPMLHYDATTGVLALYEDDGAVQGSLMFAFDANAGLLDVQGRTRTKSLQITGGMDLAEPFETSDPLVPGTVVVIDDERPGQLRESTAPYDTRVAGVISGAGGIKPGLTLSQGDSRGQNVALTGRVYVLSDASGSPIRPGDLLTTSDRPGHAMAAVDGKRAGGAILGKAMTSLEAGTGMVLVLVSLQ